MLDCRVLPVVDSIIDQKFSFSSQILLLAQQFRALLVQ